MGKMRPAPIIDGFYEDASRPFSVQDLCGWIPRPAEAQGTRSLMQLAPLPGLQEFATVSGARKQRGGYEAEDRLVFVADQTLYQCMPTGSLRIIGTIPGVSRCSFAHNGVSEVLIVNGSSGYIWNWDDDTLTQITDEGFPGGLLAAYISHLFVVIDPTRRYAQNSALDDGANWNALETFQGESKPDRIRSHAVVNGEYVLLNERSLDHFQYTGTTNALFENKQIPIDRGCAATHAVSVVDNALCFIGDDGSAYEKRGYQFQRISTGPIEQAWAKCDLSKAFSFMWEDKGHKVVYFTMPDGLTWGYDFWTRKWHRRGGRKTRWRLAWLTKWRDHWYGGEYNSGRVMRLDWDYHLEGSDRILRRRTSGVAHDNQNRLTLNELEIVADAAGEATTAASVFPLTFDLDQYTVNGITYAGDLPDLAVGDVVDFYYRTKGGMGDVTFAIAGSLPAGLSFDGGHVTGTCTTAEHDNSWTVQARDEAGTTITLDDTCYVLDMLGTPALGQQGVAYSSTLTGTEGTAPYTFALTTGTLPTGLSLASGGAITGTPTVLESKNVTITMTDAAGVDQVKAYTIAIVDPVPAGLRAKLILWSDMEETSGTTAVEYVEGNTGLYRNCSAYTVASPLGTIGKRFNGSASASCVFPATSLNGIRGPMSIAQWFKKGHDAHSAYLFMRAGSGGSGEECMSIYMGNPDASPAGQFSLGTKSIGGASNITHRPFSDYEYFDDTWHFFVWTYTRTGTSETATTSQTKFYVDGVLKQTYTNTAGDNGALFNGSVAEPYCLNAVANRSDYNVGGGPNNTNGVQGGNDAVAQIIACQGAMTQAEVTYLYNAGTGKRWATFDTESGG